MAPFCVVHAAFQVMGQLEVDLFQHYYTLSLEAFWVENVQLSLDISGELCLSSFCISSPSSVQVSGKTCHRSTQTYYCRSILLDGSSLAFHSAQHIDIFPLSYCTKSCNEYSGRLGYQGSTISTFNPLATQRCVLHRQVFSSSVCQAMAGVTQACTRKVYQQCWKELASLVCSRGCTKQCHF